MSSTRHSSRFTYKFGPVVFISSSFWYFSFHLAYTIIIIIATTAQAAAAAAVVAVAIGAATYEESEMGER